MKKTIRTRGEFRWKFQDYFITEILSKYYVLERVEDNPELTIGLVEPRPLTREFINSPKKILVAGENLNYRFNLLKFLDYFNKKTKINPSFLKKLLPDNVLYAHLGLMRKSHFYYIKSLSKNQKEGEYAIISNNIKGKNIFNLPFFLQAKSIRDNLERLKNKKQQKKIPPRFCCIIISNEASLDRIDFFKRLSKYKKIDCFGKTRYTNSNNELLPKSWADNPEFLSRYKFVISFENSFEEEYITEKLPNTMLAGSIPIYKGAPNIGEYFNTKSFINFTDCGCSYTKMINKIMELDKDAQKYLEFLKEPWQTKGNIRKIEKKERAMKNFLRKALSG